MRDKKKKHWQDDETSDPKAGTLSSRGKLAPKLDGAHKPLV